MNKENIKEDLSICYLKTIAAVAPAVIKYAKDSKVKKLYKTRFSS